MKERNIALAIILSIITCGIYELYWLVMLSNEAKSYSEDATAPNGGMALLLTIVTCGIYGIYWAWKLGEMMKQAQTKNNLQVKDNSVLYIVLACIGLSIIDYAIIQNDLNAITRLKNGTAQ